jgi:hypothetical protein
MNSLATPPLDEQVVAAVPAAVGPAELCVSHIFSIGKERPLFEKKGTLICRKLGSCHVLSKYRFDRFLQHYFIHEKLIPDLSIRPTSCLQIANIYHEIEN